MCQKFSYHRHKLIKNFGSKISILRFQEKNSNFGQDSNLRSPENFLEI